MALQDRAAAIVDCPGGESSRAAKARPIDLNQLTRQTMGDRALEQEVLSLFVTQALGVRDRIAHAGARERFNLAHSLKGSARSIGANALAECAAAIEANPSDKAQVRKLGRLIEELRDFVAAISR